MNRVSRSSLVGPQGAVLGVGEADLAPSSLTLLLTKQALRNCFAKGDRQVLRVVCRLPSRAYLLPAIPEVAMSRTRRRPYPSDLSDAEWALLEPLLASPERRGRPPKWSARRIADAVFYLLRSGCAWRMLPRREYPTAGRRSTTTSFASGGETGGGGKPTTGSGRRCANRRARIAIL